jgi:hypothetical protein
VRADEKAATFGLHLLIAVWSLVTNMNAHFKSDASAAEFTQRVQANQRKLRSELKSHYDFIVGGSGSSGSVVAGRLAENPDVSVFRLEAGGDDDVPSVREVGQWPASEGNWDESVADCIRIAVPQRTERQRIGKPCPGLRISCDCGVRILGSLIKSSAHRVLSFQQDNASRFPQGCVDKLG